MAVLYDNLSGRIVEAVIVHALNGWKTEMAVPKVPTVRFRMFDF